MTTWDQQSIHSNMHVYSADNVDLGHVVAAYEDSFAIHKGIFEKERYLPYAAITAVEKDRIQLQMSSDEVGNKQWEVRPDYENHLGDPVQLTYDRGHDVHDPFDELKPPQQA
jgi:hypothetical protein